MAAVRHKTVFLPAVPLPFFSTTLRHLVVFVGLGRRHRPSPAHAGGRGRVAHRAGEARSLHCLVLSSHRILPHFSTVLLAPQVLLPLKSALSGPEGPLLARIDDASEGRGDVNDPTSVYPRIFAAQDVVFARRARAGRAIDLTCLQFGAAARVLGMP